MSQYKYLDENGLIYYHSKIKALLNGKVDKVDGKGLSTNDYTTAEKNKLNGIATGAEVNQKAFSCVVDGDNVQMAVANTKTDTFMIKGGDGITVGGSPITNTVQINAKVTGVKGSSETTYRTGDINITKANIGLSNVGNFKAVSTAASQGLTDTEKSNARTNIGAGTGNGTITGVSVNGTSVATSGVANITSVPASILSGAIPSAVTATTQAAGNNSTKVATTAFVKTAVDNAIGSITGIDFQVVQTLPSTGTKGVIYLVPNSGTGQNIYDEYIWITSTSKFEKIGTTDIDLSGYVPRTEMVTITNAEIDAIVA